MAAPVHLKRMAAGYIFIFILMLMTIGLLYRISSEWFVPSIVTIHYLYSALFQGFAALVGVLLFLLGFMYQRTMSLPESLEKIAFEKSRFLTNIEGITALSGVIDKLRQWHDEGHYREKAETFRQTLQDYRSGASEDMHGVAFHAQYNYLKMINGAYREAAATIGRNELEKGRVRWLPTQLFIALTPSLGVMFLSLILLAFSDAVSTQSVDTQRFLALCVIAAAILALAYVAVAVTNMFAILFEEDSYWITKSGLPDTKEVDALLKEANDTIKAVAVRHGAVEP
jgi:hypothetical protein